MRRDRRRQLINRRVKNRLKLAIKLARQKPGAKNVSAATRQLDLAAKKNIIHTNKASRLKARLQKMANKTSANSK